jgi:hypothetical protein
MKIGHNVVKPNDGINDEIDSRTLMKHKRYVESL